MCHYACQAYGMVRLYHSWLGHQSYLPLSAILQFVVENIELYSQILHVQLQYILQNTTSKLEVQWLGFTSKGA